nr:ABC transporter permease [Saprospiraceae bacterium]
RIDQFHEHKGRLYQVMRNTMSRPGEVTTHASNSDLLAPALKSEMPEVEHIVPVAYPDTKGILKANNKQIRAHGLAAGQDFFQAFSFPLLLGRAADVLVGVNKIVISDQLAAVLFGSSEQALDQLIELDQEDYEGVYSVSGVFGKSGYRSSEEFDYLIPNEQFLSQRNPAYVNWGSNAVQVYLSLQEGVNMEDFNDKIKDFVRSRFQIDREPEGMDWVGQLFLRPYASKYLKGRFENGVVAGGRIEYIWLFSLIAIFIVLIASINFMNLSTAQVSRKFKQIGVQQVVGAGRKTIVFQYLGEALSISLIAAVIAMGVVYLLIPSFNLITGKQLQLSWEPDMMLVGFLFVTTVGLLSGTYPALYLSRFNPVHILKGNRKSAAGKSWLRRGLVVFQFGTSSLLIVGVLVVSQQVKYVQSKDLGYRKDNVIVFEREEKLLGKLDFFSKELNKIPGVVASSVIEDRITDISGWTKAYQPPAELSYEAKPNLYEAVVGHDFFKTLSIEMKAGRPFSRTLSRESDKIILNERAVSAIGLEDPLGKVINWKGSDKEIIGICRDFHGQSLHEAIKPMAILFDPEETNTIMARIQSGTEEETLAAMQDLYHRYYPGLSFPYTFLDEEYQSLYVAEQRVANLSGYFAGIAIVISCLGLFGLVTFSIQRKVKEIGVRKVLGATRINIFTLLSKDFLSTVFWAVLIALTIGYVLASKWLNNFAYHIDLSWLHFVLAGLAALLIALGTIAWQIYKAGLLQPVDCLRDE